LYVNLSLSYYPNAVLRNWFIFKLNKFFIVNYILT
jgi:hypothetical protein